MSASVLGKKPKPHVTVHVSRAEKGTGKKHTLMSRSSQLELAAFLAMEPGQVMHLSGTCKVTTTSICGPFRRSRGRSNVGCR